jgi:hypothetical protein
VNALVVLKLTSVTSPFLLLLSQLFLSLFAPINGVAAQTQGGAGSFGLSGAPRGADLDREQAYDMVDKVFAELNLVDKTTRDVIEQLNRTQAARLGDTDDSPSAIMLQVMNKHHLSLEWLNHASQDLNAELQFASQQLSRVYSQTRVRGAGLRL